ncbi:MAG: thioredoxin domain-containing protein [Candidatus Krumholzibacteria bacterium]|nr:thioredoxin domain-containing protein [Candidatus Krumholzibacteria bacterium]
MKDTNGSDDNNMPAESAIGPRTVQDIRRDGNHLRDESSLYLLQHAHNPLDWYPWGEEALARAKAEDKPIFLSIGYSSCHWCHVMEHEVFEDNEVAQFMNEYFICIKVDREERPDLDSVYMDAVQAMTGRGGWPMSVFLTPELKPFHGGTYFPREQFSQLVHQIVEVYETRRSEIDQQADQVASRVASEPPMTIGGDGRELGDGLLVAAVERGLESYDAVNGGFQQRQKFPTPVKWRFLLHDYRRRGDADQGEMIAHTLTAMQGGGIQDHLAGGFHRYTVDHRWTVPHFEKMLYDNGQLAGLFIEGGVALERSDFTATGLEVLDFLLADMRGQEGGFYSSYDADSGGEEGTYYVWSIADISAVVGEVDGPVLADVLGVDEKGNFEHTGKSVLTRRTDLQKIADRHGRSLEEVTGLFARHKAALRETRDQRTPPGLDRKIITSWNGLTIASLAQGYAVTGQQQYLDGARRAADFLLSTHRREDGTLWRASNSGRVSGEGILDDYAFLTDGLLELYQVSGETKYLAAARELTDHAREDFKRDGAGFYMASTRADAPLGRTVDYFDSVIPSGNAIMFRNLVKLAALTGETVYLTEAREGLDGWSGLLDRGGLELAGWLDAVACIVGPYYDVVIAGDDETAQRLRRAFLTQLPASAVLSTVPADGADEELLALAPALAEKKAIAGAGTAYVCEFGTCLAPTGDVEKMMGQVLVGWQK